jgi:hypothetical protein
MIQTRQLGTTLEVEPQAPVMEFTRVFPAGVITFGVERRDAAHVSIHVCGTEDGYEYLRFDVFADEPHYHYLRRRADGEIANQVIGHDVAANGDMLTWAVACLRARLPEMLSAAGGSNIAKQLEMPLVEFVIDVVAQAAEDARRG